MQRKLQFVCVWFIASSKALSEKCALWFSESLRFNFDEKPFEKFLTTFYICAGFWKPVVYRSVTSYFFCYVMIEHVTYTWQDNPIFLPKVIMPEENVYLTIAIKNSTFVLGKFKCNHCIIARWFIWTKLACGQYVWADQMYPKFSPLAGLGGDQIRRGQEECFQDVKYLNRQHKIYN